MSKFLIDDYLKMYNNSDIQKVLFRNRKVFTYEQISNWIDKCLGGNVCVFSMINKKTNEYIGVIEIILAEDNIGEVVISITPDQQNKHYGTEAIRAIVKYGYEKVGLNDIELNVYKSNKRAIHCYEKVGFVLAGDGYTEEDVQMKYKKKEKI